MFPKVLRIFFLALVVFSGNLLRAQTKTSGAPTGGGLYGPATNAPACTVNTDGQPYTFTDSSNSSACGDAAGSAINDCYCDGPSGLYVDVDNAAGGGEANTGANLGAGVGVFETKSTTVLQFNSLVSQNTLLTIAEDDLNNEIDFTINEANFTLSNLGGSVTDSQVPDTVTLTNITQITNRAISDTTGNLAASRVDDGGAAATQALFSGAAGAAGFRALADADIPNNITIDLAAQATNLAANGGNCTAGQFPLGVDASGAAESCTALPTTISGTSNEVSASASTGPVTLSLPATIDLGGKTSLEIPNGASPTVDAFGEIVGDSDLWAASRGAPVFYDGTAAVALVGVLVSDAPQDGQVPKWNTGGTITWEDDSGVGGGASEIGDLTDLKVTRNADTGILNIASGRARFGNTIYSIGAATVELDDASTTGDVEIFVSEVGVLTAAHTGGMTVICTGCTALGTGAGIQVTAIPLARWSSSSTGAWDASGIEKRALSNGIVVVNGPGLAATDLSGVRTLSVDIVNQTDQANPDDGDKIMFQRISDGFLRDISIGELKTEIGAGAASNTEILFSNNGAVDGIPGSVWNGTLVTLPSLTVNSVVQTLSNASDPVFSVTDTDNSITTEIGSVGSNGYGFSGTLTAHDYRIYGHNTHAATVGTGGIITLINILQTDNLGIDFAESDTNPGCAAGNYRIFADLSETTLKKCINGVESVLDTGGTPGTDSIGTVQLDDGADTPGSGDYVRVDTVDQAGFEYRTPAEVLGDIGAAASGHTHGSSTLDTDSVSADELNATGVEAELEAVLDLQDLQGAVTDSQVPDNIAITLLNQLNQALNCSSPAELTLNATGDINIPNNGCFDVDTEADASSDTWDGGGTCPAGTVFAVRAESDARTVILDSSGMQVIGATNQSLDQDGDVAFGFCPTTNVKVIWAFADEAGAITASSLVATGSGGNEITGAASIAAGSAAGKYGFGIDTDTDRLATTENGGSQITYLAAAQQEVDSADLAAANKTHVISWGISDPAVADSHNLQWLAPANVTITAINCSTDTGTADIELEERALTTPNTAGTAVMGADLQCDNNNAQDLTFSNASIASGALLSLEIAAVASAPGQVRVHVTYTID